MKENLPIEKVLQSQELFELFKSQLKKDFEECTCDANFTNSLVADLPLVIETVARELKRNEKRSDFNLQQLLYRIDLQESLLKKSLQSSDNMDYHDVLAELIVKRILQKIVLKKYFS
ncbi:MAG: hypothetical protein AB7O73_08095 [Bacteroidia bacterium]